MWKKIGRICISFLLLFFTFSTLLYSEINFTARVDRARINLSESIQLTITLEGYQKGFSVSRPDLPAFKIQGPYQSSSTRWVNGVMSSSINQVFTLFPKKAGRFVIPAFSGTFNGRRYSTRPINIEVVKDNSTAELKDYFFVKTSVSKKNPYLGEQVLLTLKFYFNRSLNIRDLTWNAPEPENCWVENLGKPRQSHEIYRGQDYGVVELKQVLFPLKDGQLLVKDIFFKFNLLIPKNRRSQRRSFFDMDIGFDSFFGGGHVKRPVRIDADPLSLRVIPLPLAGKPPGFKGLVGDFSVSSSMEKTNLKEGESNTLTIEVFGRGSLKELQKIEFPPTEELKFYYDKVEDTSGVKSDSLVERKVFKVAVVPLKKGEVKVPSYDLTFFNTEEKRYKTIRVNFPAMFVAENRELVKNSQLFVFGQKSEGSQKKKVEQKGINILPVRLKVSLTQEGKFSGIQSLDLVCFIFFPFFLLLGQEAFFRFRDLEKRDPAAYRKARALTTAVKSLKSAVNVQNNILEQYRLCTRAVLACFEAWFCLPENRLTPDSLQQQLKKDGKINATTEKIIAWLHHSDARQYGSAGESVAPKIDALLGYLKEVESEFL
ncbi:BatD family protein [Candidatus Riflebacteria bacterium]